MSAFAFVRAEAVHQTRRHRVSGFGGGSLRLARRQWTMDGVSSDDLALNDYNTLSNALPGSLTNFPRRDLARPWSPYGDQGGKGVNPFPAPEIGGYGRKWNIAPVCPGSPPPTIPVFPPVD